jgi:hypothetical protein
VIKEDEMSIMHVPCVGRRVLVGNPEGKRLLGWHRQMLENNKKMDFKKLDVGAWTGLIWLR